MNEQKPAAKEPLRLDGFVPYRLSVLANVVSRSVARIYATRFDLTIPEWRVMAVLGLAEGDNRPISANSVAARTAMDKVQVSRAVSRMLENGLLDRATDADDRRRSILKLSERGRAMYEEIVPAALAYERTLLERLTEEDRGTLDQLLDKLTAAARALDAESED